MKIAVKKCRTNLDASLIHQLIPNVLGVVKNETTGVVEIYFDEDVMTGEELERKIESLEAEKSGGETV